MERVSSLRGNIGAFDRPWLLMTVRCNLNISFDTESSHGGFKTMLTEVQMAVYNPLHYVQVKKYCIFFFFPSPGKNRYCFYELLIFTCIHQI